tara:strand:+ start:2853 stop:4019 length:1167 start_codon:yes stop_codon:yes gene_type:complete
MLLVIILKNKFSIIILNILILVTIFFTDVFLGQKEQFEYFYRAHEKYQTKEMRYKKNISDKIFMRFGDIYVLDGGLDDKRELIKESRVQNFITDKYGLRNDKYEINEADILLVGDSFISALGTSQEFTPANLLSEVLNKKVATISWSGVSPKDYENLINEYSDKIKKDAKIFIFYFEGNDFTRVNFTEEEKTDDGYIIWRGYKIKKWKAKIRFAYERLERNKDKFLLKIINENNYFLKNIRSKSHYAVRVVFSKWTGTGSPIKYLRLKDNYVGFYYNKNYSVGEEFNTYIIKDRKILDRIDKIFFIPTKMSVYSNILNKKINNQAKFLILKTEYNKLNKNVYDLTDIMQIEAEKFLKNNKFLFWKDDTHWNQNGIIVAMKYIKDIITK